MEVVEISSMLHFPEPCSKRVRAVSTSVIEAKKQHVILVLDSTIGRALYLNLGMLNHICAEIQWLYKREIAPH